MVNMNEVLFIFLVFVIAVVTAILLPFCLASIYRSKLKSRNPDYFTKGIIVGKNTVQRVLIINRIPTMTRFYHLALELDDHAYMVFSLPYDIFNAVLVGDHASIGYKKLSDNSFTIVQLFRL
jgi:hypothetical protein